MALKWNQFAGSDYYRKLPEAEQGAARRRFFDDQVAPRYSAEQREGAWADFDRRATMMPATVATPAQAPASIQRPQANVAARAAIATAAPEQAAMPQRPVRPGQVQPAASAPAIAAPAGGAGFVEGVKDFGRGIARGVVEDLPAAVAGLTDFADTPDFDAQGKMTGDAGASEWARDVKAGAEQRGENWQESEFGRQMRERDAFSARGAAYEAGKAMPLSFGGGLAGAATGAAIGSVVPGLGTAAGAGIGYVAGSIASLPLFFGHQAKDTYDKVFAQTKQEYPQLSDEDAHDRAISAGGMTGAIEAGGEMVADLVGAKLFKLLPSGAKQGMVRAATKSFQGVRPMIADMLKIVGTEVGTELAQGASQSAVEASYGVGEGPTWDNQKGVIMPTVLMSLVGGGAAVGMSARERYRTSKLLANPSFTPQQRLGAAQNVARALHQQDPELAKLFFGEAQRQIAAGKPVIAEDDKFYRDLKPLAQREEDQRMAAGEDMPSEEARTAAFGEAPADVPRGTEIPPEAFAQPEGAEATDTLATDENGDILIEDGGEPTPLPDIQLGRTDAPIAGELYNEGDTTDPVTGARVPGVAPPTEQPITDAAAVAPPAETPDAAPLTPEARKQHMNAIGANLKVLRAERDAAKQAGDEALMAEVDDEIQATAVNFKRLANNQPPLPTPREQAAGSTQNLGQDPAQNLGQAPAMPEAPALGPAAARPKNDGIDLADEQPVKALDDERMQDPDFRNWMEQAVGGLVSVKDGNLGLAVDPNFIKGESDRGDEVRMVRAGSVNPPWFQEIAAAENVSVDGLRGIVKKAMTGAKLGVRQDRAVRKLMDAITDERIGELQDWGRGLGMSAEEVAGLHNDNPVAHMRALEAEVSARQKKAADAEVEQQWAEQDAVVAGKKPFTPDVVLGEDAVDLEGVDFSEAGQIASQVYATAAGWGVPIAQLDELHAQAPDAESFLSSVRTAIQEIRANEKARSERDKAGSLADIGGQGAPESGESAAAEAERLAAIEQARAEAIPALEEYLGTDWRKDNERRARLAAASPDELVEEVYRDKMTGLLNKRAWNEDVVKAGFEKEGRRSKPSTIAYIDLDGLKFLNDEMGHAAGDELLANFGAAMKAAGIDGYHISGDEFGAIFENEADASEAMDRLQREVESSVVRGKAKDGRGITNTGIAFSYGLGGSANSADMAMQENKKAREAQGLRGGARGGMPSTAAYDEESVLQPYDQAAIDAKAAEDKARAKKDADAAAKQKADDERGEFVLAGSARPADQAAARGAQDMFSGGGEAPAAPKAKPSANTIFTEDAAEKARAVLRAKLGQVSTGIDPEIVQAGITLAGYHIEKGARSFSAYAKAMLADLGDAVRPYLKSWYVAISLDPRAAAFDGMDSYDAVKAVDVDAITSAPESDPINAAAHEAATSPQNDLPEPTDAEKEAGNYKLGHLAWNGLGISIENPAGSVRRGTDEDGKAWENTLQDHYGYLKLTTGNDGDHVDVFLNADENRADTVFVIDQMKNGGNKGAFDEHKVLLGYPDKASAVIAYKRNYAKGWGVGPVTEMTVDEFKKWLADGDQTRPVEAQAPTEPQKSKGHIAWIEPTPENPARRELVARDDGKIGIADASNAIDMATGNRFSRSQALDTPENRARLLQSLTPEANDSPAAGPDPLAPTGDEAFDAALKNRTIRYAMTRATMTEKRGEYNGVPYVTRTWTASVKLRGRSERDALPGYLKVNRVLPEPVGEDTSFILSTRTGSNVGDAMNAEIQISRTEFDYQDGKSGQAATPAWHTEIPAEGLPLTDAQRAGKGMAYEQIPGIAAADAYDAVTQAQKMNGGQMYAYALPAADGRNGIVRLFPDDQTPPAPWALVNGEALRPFMQSKEQVVSKLAGWLRSAPIIGDAKSAAPKPVTPKKPVKKASTLEAQRADYFAPGNIVEAYIGHDRVIAYHPPTDNGNWSVEVIAVEKKDGQWVDAPGERPRQHSTEGKYAKGPVERAAAKVEPEPTKAPAAVASPGKIGDFGERIEGAAKYRDRYEKQMEDALEADIAAVPLSESWPEPDYEKMLEEGAEPGVVAFVHAARDEIPVKPKKRWKLSGWTQAVQLLRDMSNKLVNGTIPADKLAEALDKPEFARVARDVGGRADLYQAVGHGVSLKGVTLKARAYAKTQPDGAWKEVRDWAVEREAAASAFGNWPKELGVGNTREEAIADFKKKHAEMAGAEKPDAQTSFDIYRYRASPETVVIGKKIGKDRVDLAKFQTLAEARAYLKNNHSDLVAKLDAYKKIPRERRLTNEPRVGVNHRNGSNVTAEQFQETFGFRGGQFGSSLLSSQKEAQTHLNEAYDALMDMAGVLGIPPRALSLNGELALAFGARGKGGKDAASAHYEPDTKGAVTDSTVVINLTRKRGAGSLAHEWFHALDNYFARARQERAGFLTEKPFPRGEGVRPEMVAAFKGLMDAIKRTSLEQRSKALDARRTKAYWATGLEMAARSFESYVIEKLRDQGASNDYLANIVSPEYWAAEEALRDFGAGPMEQTYPYPTAAEVPEIRAAFDHFFGTIETQETDKGIAIRNQPGAYWVNGEDAALQEPALSSVEAPPAGRRNAALPSPNLELFAPNIDTAVPKETARQQSAENFRILIEQVEARRFKSAIGTVKTPEDAAHVLLPLAERAQEEFLALVTTPKGKILHIIGHAKGNESGASVYPGLISGAIAATDGATDVWIAHNHPSGVAEPSQADLTLTRRLRQAFKDMGVSYKGHIILGDVSTSFLEPNGSEYPLRITPTAGDRKRFIPVTERVFRKRERAGQLISSPNDARQIMSGAEGSGVLLLDNQHGVIGWLQMSPDEMRSLKGNNFAGVQRLLRTFSKTGTVAFMARIEGEQASATQAANNLAAFARQYDARMLDAFLDPVTPAAQPVSMAERGTLSPVGAFMSRSSDAPIAGHTEQSLYGRLRDIFGAKFMDRLFQTGKFRVINSADAARILGPDALRSTDDLLSTYTEGDIQGQSEQAKAEKKRAEKEAAKRAADEQRDGFVLTGSNSTADQAAARGQGSLFSANGSVRGFFNPADGITYLVADGIPQSFTDDQLRGLMRHELGVHALNAGRDSKGWQAILGEIDRLVKAGDKAAVAAMNRAQAAGTPEGHLLEEVAGYLVEDAPSASIVRQILAWLKDQVYKLTGLQLKLTDADVVAMAQAALRAAPRALSARDSASMVAQPAYSAPAPVWVSALKQRIVEQGAKTRTGNDWAAWLLGNAAKLSIKKDEIEWSGITDYLAARGKDKLNTTDITDWLGANGVQVQEVELGEPVDQRGRIGEIRANLAQALEAEGYGIEFDDIGGDFDVTYLDEDGDAIQYDELSPRAQAIVDRESQRELLATMEGPKFDQYQLPGGENYRELLLTLPVKEKAVSFEEFAQAYRANNPSASEGSVRREYDRQVAEIEKTQYRSSHFDQPNILAHVRFNERTDAEGRRVLFVEELQSDWAQEGRRKGFSGPAPKPVGSVAHRGGQWGVVDSDGNFWRSASREEAERSAGIVKPPGTQPAPFVTDTKAWTKLALSRMIRYAVDNGFDAVAWTTGEQQYNRYHDADAESDTEKKRAEGMRAFYDGIVPQVARDLLKKLGGGSVGSVEMNTDQSGKYRVWLPDIGGFHNREFNQNWQAGKFAEQVGGEVREVKDTAPQPGFPITDRMREIAGRGMAMFSRPTVRQGRIRRTIDELIEAAESQKDWRDWYKRHEDTLIDLFGNDADLFQKILSATSQMQTVPGNVTMALRAYEQYLSGAPFTGYLSGVIKNLERIRNDEAIRGPKIADFQTANAGDEGAMAVDRHIAMLLFNTTTPNARQIVAAKDRMRAVAARMGWTPRQVQAALWAYNQVRKGTDPAKVRSYDTILETRADFIAALRSQYGRGEGGSVQAGSAAAARNQEGLGAQPAQVGGALFSRAALPLTVDATDPSVPQTWYRGQTGERAGKGPFDATAIGAPSFTDSPLVASAYAQNPDAAGLYGMQGAPEGAADNANVAPYTVRGKLFDIRSLQGGHNTQTGITPAAARKILDALGLDEADAGIADQWSAKWGRGKSAYYDAAEADVPDSRRILAPHMIFDSATVHAALAEKGYAGAVFNGSMDEAQATDTSIPWGERVVHAELRAIDRQAIRSRISPDVLFSRAQNPVQGTMVPPAQPPAPPQQGTLNVQGGATGPGAQWTATPTTPLGAFADTMLYRYQDKQIDLKRTQQAIKAAGRQINEASDAYLKEELFHGRAATRAKEFLEDELDPLIADMRARGVSQEDLGRYLWARHAQEANEHIAAINPALPDGGSGMLTQEAQDYLAALTPQQQADYAALAARVDAITQTTRNALVNDKLISAQQRQDWESAYQHYVPLFRELDANDDIASLMMQGAGTGQGYSIKGAESKRRTGSQLPVADILGNIANARDKAIVRGEKARVGRALYALALNNKNPDFWRTAVTAPTIKTHDKNGMVIEIPDPMFKQRDNVVVVKVPTRKGNIVERAVVFNERDPRALRMAHAIKNLDGQQLGEFLGATASVTRYFASINTQYNPIFGVVNLIRDVQMAMLNLSSTPLAGKQAAVAADMARIVAGAMKHGLRDFDGPWKAIAREFEEAGGMTGYRDMFRTGQERTEAIEKALDPNWWQKRPWGRALTADGYLKAPAELMVDKGVRPVMEWLSDYNQVLENATRLAAYKQARNSKLSKDASASIAKNLTVNFNRKGEMALQLGALYAFFNAATQGIARMGQTFAGPAGKYIVGGGVLAGVLQAMLLAAAGYDDEEPPQFVRERALILPTPWNKDRYVSIPMPLGFHVLPNFGRLIVEAMRTGDLMGKTASMMGIMADAFNPLGGSAPVAQILSPTATDPFVALGMNKDWTGKPIAREDFSNLHPTPGFTRARDAAGAPARWLAKALNRLSGGTDYTQGLISPTPDQIEYLAGQLTGGIGREAIKASTTATSIVTGDELPMHKVPLIGRFYGSTEGQAPQANKFYANLKKLNEHGATVKGLRADRRNAEVMEYLRDNPDARLFEAAGKAERKVSELRARRRALAERDASKAELKRVDDLITAQMVQLNDRMKALSK